MTFRERGGDADGGGFVSLDRIFEKLMMFRFGDYHGMISASSLYSAVWCLGVCTGRGEASFAVADGGAMALGDVG